MTRYGTNPGNPPGSSNSTANRRTITVSIASMEIIGNIMELIIPGVIMMTIVSPGFWLGLLASMSVAFVVTVPINRWMISRNPHAHYHM